MTFLLLLGLLVPAYAQEQKAQPSSATISNFIDTLTLEKALLLLAAEQYTVVSETMRIPFCMLGNSIEAELYDSEFGGIDREQFLMLFYSLMRRQASKELDSHVSPQLRAFLETLPTAHELEDMQYDISGEYVASYDQLYLPKRAQSALVALVNQYSFREKLSYLLKGFLTEKFLDFRALYDKIEAVVGKVETSLCMRYPEAYAQCYTRAQQLVAEHGNTEQTGLFPILYTPEEHKAAVAKVKEIHA